VAAKKPRTKTNLVCDLSEEEAQKLGQQLISWYEADLGSRTDWEERREDYFCLWLSKPDPKRIPTFPGGSNVGLPITASACNQFSSRAYSSVFEAPDVVKIMPTEANDVGYARRVEQYMNWQVRAEMREFESESDLLYTALPIEGTVFKKVYYCSKRKRPVTEFVPGLDVILPYDTKSMQMARRISHRYFRHSDTILDGVEDGFFDEEAVEYAFGCEEENESEEKRVIGYGGYTGEEKSKAAQLADRTQGIGEPSDTNEMPRLIVEMAFRDPMTRKPMLAWVDHQTQTVLRLTKRSWHEEEICLFADYHFIRNPYGFYSFGFGHFLKPLNRIGESIFNLTIDSARLSNQPFGFYGRRAGFRSRNIELFPGKMNEVEDASQVYFPNMQRVDQSVFQLMGLVDRYSEIFTSNSEVMSGRQQKGVREPTARGTMALIEQGMTSFGTLTKRLHYGLRGELELILKLNEMHTPEEKVFRVLGTTKTDGTPLFGRVSAADFEKHYDIYPTADPSYASNQQRRAEAAQMMDVALKHPLLGLPNPETGQVANPHALMIVTRDFLETFGKGEVARAAFPMDIDPPKDPYRENAGFMQGLAAEPNDEDDHEMHLAIHSEFEKSQAFRQMDERDQELLREHVKKTKSKLYMAEQAAADTVAQRASALETMKKEGPQRGVPEEAEPEPQPEEEMPEEMMPWDDEEADA
jgi:hypothetical protein